MPLDLIRDADAPVAFRLQGREFACEEETGQTTVPKEFLIGFRLSEIPENIGIKPVEKIDGSMIQVENDVALSQFSGGSASAAVEEMFRRKLWDGDNGLSPYVAALRQAIDETEEADETDFDDDDDYIFLHYDITITEDLEIQAAVQLVDATIGRLHDRADQLARRRRDGLLGIFDRGTFNDDLSYALSGKQPVTLVMVDIDRFKQVNDMFGHLVGDEVLRAVANVLATKCDDHYRVEYRYGGEELALIVTGDDAASADELAEVIRADVERFHFDTHPNLRVTISLG
ncbi:MAG TPA: GGDEF domain-containing protein [Candidatus Dormibacteraeota bacterium]|jgi:diguanylate cyclase (GGDEF)-like protein|nr:GGDEF domain-containing protein [Candidatus Dormibacteraeota bacterium]